MTSRNKGNKTCDDLIGVWWGGGGKNLSIGQEKKKTQETRIREQKNVEKNNGGREEPRWPVRGGGK